MKKYVYAHGRRIEVETLDTGIAPRKHRKEDLFAIVPLWWAEQAAKTVPEVLICAELLRRARWANGESFTLPSGCLEKRGVSRKVKYATLRKLEAAKTITVQWRNGKNPMITLRLTCPKRAR